MKEDDTTYDQNAVNVSQQTGLRTSESKTFIPINQSILSDTRLLDEQRSPKVTLVKRFETNNAIHPLVNPVIVFNGVKARGFAGTGNGYGYGYKYGYGRDKSIGR